MNIKNEANNQKSRQIYQQKDKPTYIEKYFHKNTSDVRGVVRTQSNNYDGAFLRK